ncbi:uncharacterized protein EV154DRAFT_94832 [Mucor mucedo]|uniref:uncharacterized protein n=1 Tax=Mucor mucedo TaxID=29922 RepID=UPI002220848E|nr:uncharacterized protein EV154DRAFT_94832 [Mucor mucedo]KAI7873391.1 hypothetical protein EV154DRAFT_94832 [Mucor mucedo]
MCFCLRQANRLIPNRFSFPLVDRGEGRQRFDVSVEEEGLLSRYQEEEEEEEEEENSHHDNTTPVHRRYEEEEEEFGAFKKSGN